MQLLGSWIWRVGSTHSGWGTPQNGPSELGNNKTSLFEGSSILLHRRGRQAAPDRRTSLTEGCRRCCRGTPEIPLLPSPHVHAFPLLMAQLRVHACMLLWHMSGCQHMHGPPHVCMLMVYPSRAISPNPACWVKHYISPCTSHAQRNCALHCMQNNPNNTGIYKVCKTCAPAVQ